MTIPLLPVSAELPAIVNAPADGEAVNSASVIGYAQTIVNGIRFASDLVKLFVNGGVANITGGLSLLATGNLVFNSLVIPPSGQMLFGVDGASSGGRIRAPKNVFQGLTGAGTYVYDPVSVDHVFNAASTTGVIWKLGGSPKNGECVTFTNFSANPIALQDPAGSLITNLRFSPGSGVRYSTTMCWNPVNAGPAWYEINAGMI